MTVLTITVPAAPDPQTLEWVLGILGATQLKVSEELALTPHERARQTARRANLTPEQRAEALRIVAAGGDGKSIVDPVAWQRETRQDRLLPFRG